MHIHAHRHTYSLGFSEAFDNGMHLKKTHMMQNSVKCLEDKVMIMSQTLVQIELGNLRENYNLECTVF